jgi:ketosteroid isomerase-like protein
MPITEQFQQLKAAFESRDLAAVMALFANDAVVIDPHYPQPEMRGKAAIKRGFEWAFGNIEKPGFTERHIWSNETSGVIEVDTHHVFRGGMKLAFQQVFVIETRNGLITRLQSYPSYGPHGIGGMLTSLVRLTWRLQGKLK